MSTDTLLHGKEAAFAALSEEKKLRIVETLSEGHQDFSSKESAKLLMSYLCSKISFRGFSRLIRSLKNEGLYKGHFIPDATTMMNWILRAGIASLQVCQMSDEPCIDIMDHWIGKGNKKLFIVLRLKTSRCKERFEAKQGLRLRDFQLIHLEIMDGSNAEKVSRSLKKCYERLGYPLGIICDNGSDLCKGLRELNTKNKMHQQKQVLQVEDLSHKQACLLKKHYRPFRWFQKFTHNLHMGQSKLTNSAYAHLRSPKQNTKARFMNISKLVDWSVDGLAYLEGSSGSCLKEVDKFREAYNSLKDHKHKIAGLKKTFDVLNECSQILKTQGLNERNRVHVSIILKRLHFKHKTRVGLEQWLEFHAKQQRELLLRGWDAPLPISSDPIESLFSCFKPLQERAPQGDPTRMVAILPLFVGEHTSATLGHLLSSCSHKQAQKWIKENIPETVHAKKRKLRNSMGRKRVTKTGYAHEKRVRPYEKAFAA